MSNESAPADGTATGERPIEVGLYGVTKRFNNVVAVDNVTIEIAHGEFFSLLGPSGCGKTTSLRMIAGFEEPDDGEVRLTGRDIVGVPPYKRNVNTVFQSYALFPHLTVFDNVAFGLRRKKVPKHEVRDRVTRYLRLVQLEGYDDRRPAQLCGGQQQRVALAARAREPARGVAARRAARRTRPQAPQADAARADAHPARGRRHVRVRDARPGRSAGDERPPGRHVVRSRRADRLPGRHLRAARDAVRRRVHRHVEHRRDRSRRPRR